jgi:hypothetical protein
MKKRKLELKKITVANFSNVGISISIESKKEWNECLETRSDCLCGMGLHIEAKND